MAAPALGLAEYAVVTLAGRAHWLALARNDVIERAVALERRRFTRDLHDLVGHRLAVLVLKAQLVERLVREGDPKAGMEAGETLELVRVLASDVRAVAHGAGPASLESELASARALLESVGVRCDVRVSCRDMPGEVSEALVHVLREGVTNILRHAAARRCVIRLDEQDRLIRLSIRNDGVRPGRRRDGLNARRGGDGDGGAGLANLTERVALLGGWLETEICDGEFAFSAFVPRAYRDRLTSV